MSEVIPAIPNSNRTILVGSILTDGKSSWRVERFDRFYVWVLSHPSKRHEVAIPFAWAVVNRLELCQEAHAK